MEQNDGRIARIETQLDSLHAWQVESAAMQAEALTEIKATNQHILQYTQVATRSLENRLEKVEQDMTVWKRIAAGIAVVSSGITAVATWWLNKH